MESLEKILSNVRFLSRICPFNSKSHIQNSQGLWYQTKSKMTAYLYFPQNEARLIDINVYRMSKAVKSKTEAIHHHISPSLDGPVNLETPKLPIRLLKAGGVLCDKVGACTRAIVHVTVVHRVCAQLAAEVDVGHDALVPEV